MRVKLVGSYSHVHSQNAEFIEDKGGAWVVGEDDSRLVRTQVGICHY